jgi:hypothetical protein
MIFSGKVEDQFLSFSKLFKTLQFGVTRFKQASKTRLVARFQFTKVITNRASEYDACSGHKLQLDSLIRSIIFCAVHQAESLIPIYLFF